MLFTVLLALFFVALFAAVITLYNRADMMKDASTSDTMKLEAVGETLNDIDNSWSETEDNLVGNYVAEATIASMALRDVIKEEGDQAIAAYSSGAVIKVEGGKLTAPTGPMALQRTCLSETAACSTRLRIPAQCWPIVKLPAVITI